jgi:uncharacterized membrane protein YqaE (UPF0057 family)
MSHKILKIFQLYGLGDWLLLGVLGISCLLVDQLCLPNSRFIPSLHDPALSHPLVSQMCPNFLLLILSIVLPFVVFILTHFVQNKNKSSSLVNLRLTLLYFCYALMLTVWLTTFGKKWIGRPRPNFYAYAEIDSNFYNSTANIDINKSNQDAFQ